jgi:hypothetical protein
MAGQPVSQPVTGPIGRTRASAANNDARQGVDDPLDVNMLKDWDGGKPRGA